MKPIFKFSDREISDELYDILCRLEKGAKVELEEIEQTPEFILGSGMCIRGLDTSLIKGREMLQEKILKDLRTRGSLEIVGYGNISFTGPVNTGKRLDVVIGLPASGKSSTVANALSLTFNSIIIDNDEVKKLIPDYRDGWGDAIVHMESKQINKKLLFEAIREGKNIVYPKVGGYHGEIEQVINFAKENGYQINLHYVELNRNKAILRLLNRFIKDGRFIPPSTVYQDDNERDGNKIRKVFDYLISTGKIDGYSYWDNDVEYGEHPKLIESHNLGENFLSDAFSKLIIKINPIAKMDGLVEQLFDNQYGKNKAKFFKMLDSFAKLNSSINVSQFNPEFSLGKLCILLKLNLEGLQIKEPSKLSEQDLLKLLEKQTGKKVSLTELIENFKQTNLNPTHKHDGKEER